jgi:hypothetical protein
MYTTEEIGFRFNKKLPQMKINKHNWNWFRLSRLLIGLVMVAIAAYKQELVPGFLGGIFIYHSILNTGCASGNCQTVTHQQNPIDIQYEEVKS